MLVFFDDILIYSQNEEDHIHHLKTVFDILRSHKLFVKLSKCEFAKTELKYLGHAISQQGVAADCQKIKAMMEWPKPNTIKG